MPLVWRLSPRRLRLIPNGIPLDPYLPADGNPELRNKLGIPLDVPVVGSCLVGVTASAS